jgi:Flp pilus assembly pilin Flp
MVEYALILTLIALVAMVGLSVLGISVRQVLTELSNGITNAAVVTGSPLGATFSEISDALIKLTQDFYQKNHHWPSSWMNYAYTDLGLNPADWKEKAYNGIIYKPVGNGIAITPADGYTFLVTDIKGNNMTLPSSYNWNLWYDVTRGTWNYHTRYIGPILQIKTLKVVPTQP